MAVTLSHRCSLSYSILTKNLRTKINDVDAPVTPLVKRAVLELINHQFRDEDCIRLLWQRPRRSVLQNVNPIPQPKSIPVQLYEYQLRALSWYANGI